MRVLREIVGVVAMAHLLLDSPRSVAHDLWLIPPEGTAAKSTATVRANSGMDFPLSEHASDPAKFERRILIRPDGSPGTLSAGGAKEKSGLLNFDTAGAGSYVVAVQTQPKIITLTADEFNHYLISDGLPHIYQLRRREGQLTRSARERYSKSPKALVEAGKGGGGDPCRVVGLPLEIIPLRNPINLRLGDTLRVRVLFRNSPLEDGNLGWDLPGDGEPPSGTVRTDARGEALVPISQTGLMTIRLTHMTRPKAADYEWESFWTTLTFRIAK